MYSTAQKKPNRGPRTRTGTERIYRMGTRMRTGQVHNGYTERVHRTDTEWISNGYRRDTEWVWNGNGSKKGKKHSGTQTIRERVLQNTW